MPIYYLRRITGRERSEATNRHLGFSLAFIAGAMNAGAFTAVKQYTTHMTGITSSIAIGFIENDIEFALAGVGSVISFLAGAAFSEILINWGRNKELQSEFALPLMIEAMLLLAFGLLGQFFNHLMGLFVSVTVMLVCFSMGLQNAIVTRVSGAVVRTTHVTGILTDVGIEFGRMFYWNRKVDKEDKAYIRAHRGKLYLLGGLWFMFLVGGLVGAFAFSFIGYYATIPLAIVLAILAFVPMFDDIVHHRKKRF